MCWDCTNHDVDPYKEFTQGGVPIDDFEDEIKYSRPPHHKKRPKKTRAGCPENDFGAHIYVWTTEYEDKLNLFYRYFGFHKREYEYCVGCAKRRGSRYTEKYEARKRREYDKRYKGTEFNVKRGEPIPRGARRRFVPSYSYWNWESYHEGFAAYRREYINRRGYTEYSWWY